MALLVNAQMTLASAPGTGDFALSAAVAGAQTFAAAGMVDGAYCTYRAEEGAGWEIGVGQYNAAVKFLSRAYVLASSAGASKVAFGAAAVVSQVAAPADLGHSFRNKLHNGMLRINQRKLTGTVTLPAGAYGHDGVKAGASGASYTLATAANGDGTMTGAGSAANTVKRIVEGVFYLPDSGSYVLTWLGTATARVYPKSSGSPPAFAAGIAVVLPNGEAVSAMSVPGVVAGADLVVEFDISSSKTLGRHQLALGLYPIPFERRDDERRRCLRYYREVPLGDRQYADAGGLLMVYRWDEEMASAPIAVIGAPLYSNNVAAAFVSYVDTSSARIGFTQQAAGWLQYDGSMTLSSEL
ncbi:hypothetical protein [Methylobacterium gnaphalii]|uniref:Uncharacterized protein n=1 Tax=Methylobacterium gnaphalii TaxID=1010610 RepID=A0A512JPD6_9HYPH|nr:hypothetical protein [Methylobacterium gnaphalii]GEP11824.1 hypothetical protein MGN01_36690 [Methylobacterium gnaphalii]GJD69408.1 hypothetical protein MMMDOFMJ_2339 [Methylobacterium gnaphalii]GLS49541.1 hypothetical protein GCM10007885_23900 [Methylobacterium gnaphalii]